MCNLLTNPQSMLHFSFICCFFHVLYNHALSFAWDCRSFHQMDASLLLLTGTSKYEYVFCSLHWRLHQRCINLDLLFYCIAINFVGHITPKESSKRGPWNTELLPWAYRVCLVHNAVIYSSILFLASFNIYITIWVYWLFGYVLIIEISELSLDFIIGCDCSCSFVSCIAFTSISENQSFLISGGGDSTVGT